MWDPFDHPIVQRLLESERRAYRIPESVAVAVMLAPAIIVFLACAFAALPMTRAFMHLMLKENYPIELATFAFLLLAGLLGLRLAWRARRHGEGLLVTVFYALFSTALIVIAMEEIAWGQWFLGFETPDVLKSINRQGEVTLHNIEGMQGHNELLRLSFGIGGLLGVWAGTRTSLLGIGAPPLLIPWFALIAVLASFETALEFGSIQHHIDNLIRELDEIVEMLVGMSAFLYLWLKGRWFDASWAGTPKF